MNHVNVTNVCSVARAAVEAPLATAENVLLRILVKARRTAVLDAIRFELAARTNRRIAAGNALPGDSPRLPLPHLERSMEHARRHEMNFVKLVGLNE